MGSYFIIFDQKRNKDTQVKAFFEISQVNIEKIHWN